jgi:hypothetical protein
VPAPIARIIRIVGIGATGPQARSDTLSGQHSSGGGIVRRGIDKPLLVVLSLIGALAVVMVARGFPLSAADS